MTRITLTQDYCPITGQCLGKDGAWFDADKATKYDEDTRFNGSNQISVNTGDQWLHEALYKTRSGKWVLNAWSQWQGGYDTYKQIDPDAAAIWLVKNGHDEAAPKKVLKSLEI